MLTPKEYKELKALVQSHIANKRTGLVSKILGFYRPLLTQAQNVELNRLRDGHRQDTKAAQGAKKKPVDKTLISYALHSADPELKKKAVETLRNRGQLADLVQAANKAGVAVDLENLLSEEEWANLMWTDDGEDVAEGLKLDFEDAVWVNEGLVAVSTETDESWRDRATAHAKSLAKKHPEIDFTGLNDVAGTISKGEVQTYIEGANVASQEEE